MNEFDCAIIGWGKGGKTLAGTLAKAGQKVAIIERSPSMYGGACINVACIPTKALIHSAENRGSTGYDPTYFASSVERRETLTGAMRDTNYAMLANNENVVVFDGEARFTGPHTLAISRSDDSLEITAETIVINTGSLPRIPRVAGAEISPNVHTSETIQHAQLPKRLIILGGGYIGLEFASMFAQYGSEVTVLDKSERPLIHEDRDVSHEVARCLDEAGARIISGANAVRICQEEPGVCVQYVWNEQEQAVRGDAVLIATGRVPNTADLDVEKAGVELTDTGAVAVDDTLRTSVPSIFAIGDVHGGSQFTYLSLDDYRIVADHILGDGLRTTKDRVAVPYTVFTTPPLARVGLNSRQARRAGYRTKVATKKVADIAAMPRPKIVGNKDGIIKIVVDADTDLILGASLHHVDSQEVINLVALAMRHNVTASELRDSIYTHPSSTEALNEVLTLI